MNSFKTALTHVTATDCDNSDHGEHFDSTSAAHDRLMTEEEERDEKEKDIDEQRCSTALSLLSSEELSVPHTAEIALTSYSDKCDTLVSRGRLVNSSNNGAMIRNEKDMVTFSPQQIFENERETHVYMPHTIIQVRESSLQIDAEPGLGRIPARPSTTPLLPSPSTLRNGGCTQDSQQECPDEQDRLSPALRRNSAYEPSEHHHHPTHSHAFIAQSIDLSGETLEVSPDSDKFVLPASARSIVGPEDRVVSQLLAGHVHSTLIGVEGEQYVAHIGPDDLPGMCAWKLVSAPYNLHSFMS